MNLFIPGNSRFLTLCEVEVYGEGAIKQADLVFWETKTIVKLLNIFTTVDIWQHLLFLCINLFMFDKIISVIFAN